MSDTSSQAEEIPFRKTRKSPETNIGVANTQDEDDEEMEEDEYAVESIIDHRFRKNVLELLVKWQGYPLEESTWEPESNLDNCVDDLNNYYAKIGGRPKPKVAPAAAKATSVKKRKLSTPPADESQSLPIRKGNPPGRRKKEEPVKLQQRGSSKKSDPAAGIFPEDSWEEYVLNVDTMEKDDATGRIFAFLVWKDNAKTRHPTEVVYKKCPQKCLQFYEAHLQFHTPDPPKPTSTNADSHDRGSAARSSGDLEAESRAKPNFGNDDIVDDDDDEEAVEESLDLGVKGVASTMVV